MAHVVPHVKRKHVTHHGYVIVGGQQDPVMISGHSQQLYVQFTSVRARCLKGETLLVKEE